MIARHHALGLASYPSRVCRAFACAGALALLAPPAASQEPAAPAGEPAAQPAQATPAPPAAIPVPEVAQRAEELAAALRELEAGLAPEPALQEIESRLPGLSERIAARLEATEQILSAGAQLHAAGSLASAWQTLRAELDAASSLLTRRATILEADVADLQAREEIWRLTRDEARASQAPKPVLARIQAALELLRATRERAEKRRSEVLLLQDRVTRERAACDDALGRLAQYRSEVVGKILVRDSAPVWRIEVVRRNPGEVAARVRDAAQAELIELREYARGRASLLVIAGGLFLGLAVLLRRSRRRARRWLEQEPALATTVRLIQRPWSAAWILTLLLLIWGLESPPHLFSQLIGLAVAFPVLRVLLHVIDPAFRFALYGAVGFFVTDRLRDLLSAVPFLAQALFLLEMLAAAALVLWLMRPARLRRLDAAQVGAFSLRLLALLLRTLGLLVAVAFVAGSLGTMQLARLLGEAALTSVYAALLLYVGRGAAASLVAVALRLRPLALLRMVRMHRHRIERRVDTALGWLALVLWVGAVLAGFELLQPALSMLRAALAAEIMPGPAEVTLGDLVAFVLTLWAAFLVSRFVRFALEEDVFPRAHLARGVPYAASSLLHYTILFGGFLLALSAIGLDINRFTVLAGAFGVGIGFGLQNVVHNFVSGLILLFERPIQVGDTVQIGDLMGDVRRIGIRSSTLRTAEGAEVILPNASLISDHVTNWTLSDRMRRIDVPVGVAYGSDPDRVLELLTAAARSVPGVVQQPEPLALFTGFGESALDFQLRVWTDRLEDFFQVRSALVLAMHHALRDAGIEIPFPQRDLHLRSAPPQARTTLPDERPE